MGLVELWPILSEALHLVAKNRGRDPEWESDGQYSVWHVLKVYLLCVLMRISPNLFYERLKRGKGPFRRQWGLPNRLISLSQLNKRLKRPETFRALLALLQDGAKRVLRVLGEEEVNVVAMDLTRLESPIHDQKAAWGFDSRGPFKGYKLGLIVSKSGVILGMSLMKANWTESKVHRRLLRLARETIQTTWEKMPVEYLVCDAGFDGEPFARATREVLRVPQLCPARRQRNPRAKTAKKQLSWVRNRAPHRYRNQQLWETLPERESIYAKRTVVEQVNGQLKDSMGMGRVPPSRRGVKRLLPLCLAKLVIYNFALNVNAIEMRGLRQIRRLVC